MPELILPGVYIEVRPEALIVPGPISVGNIGIVGTARRGPIGEVQILSGYADATEIFGSYDALDAPDAPSPAPLPLDPPTPAVTLVRALEIAYANGASTVFAVRVTSRDGNGVTKAKKASHLVAGTNVTLTAKHFGAWPATITVEETVIPSGATDPVRLTLKYGTTQEVYIVADGVALLAQVNAGSVLVDATTPSNVAATGKPTPTPATPPQFAGGDNGAAAKDSDYKAALDLLTNENAHIIVAAGLDDTVIGDELKSHVENASTDKIKRDRIAVIGSRAKGPSESNSAFLADVSTPTVTGDRIIFVTPGFKATDAAKAAAGAADPSVVLPGAYAAAAVAGMLSARDPHVSLTNKTVSAAGLETRFNSGQLEQLVQGGVLGLEERRGIRVVKGITTDTGAFRQITTRRIVDFAKFGVRSAAEPYIGLLNNDRVRKALKGSINGFLASMVDDEMLVSYELDVTASRDEEIRGIAKVIMTVRPTFSIDYIKVVMFLG